MKKIKEKQIYGVPLPNGVVLGTSNKISICWMESGEHYQLLIPREKERFTFLSDIPIIRGIHFLLVKIIYQAISLSIQKQKIPQTTKNKKTSAISQTIIKYILTAVVIVINLLIIYILSYFLLSSLVGQLVLLTFAFILIVSSLIIVFYIWIGKEKINNTRRYHQALYDGMDQIKNEENVSFYCPISKTIFLLLLTTYLNSLVPILSQSIIINTILSIICFFLIFGFVFDIYEYISKNIHNKFLLLFYLPVILLKKNLKLPAGKNEKKATKIAFYSLIDE